MRRQRRTPILDDDESATFQAFHDETANFLQMERLPRGDTTKFRFENTIEAKVEDGDTLQALALKFHCSLADIKRLNKIDRDNEIHARKVIKIPVTVYSVLLGASLPAVHISGHNSPTHSPEVAADTDTAGRDDSIMHNPLELSEKLMIASVNASGSEKSGCKSHKHAQSSAVYTDANAASTSSDAANDMRTALLHDFLNDGDSSMPRLRPIPGPSAFKAFEWSGSDCDMSWACLFVVILALCFIIPLVYVLYLAEHSHHHNSTSL